MSLGELRVEGDKWLGAHPGELEKRWTEIKADDSFTFVYTSGTTGPPEGRRPHARATSSGSATRCATCSRSTRRTSSSCSCRWRTSSPRSSSGRRSPGLAHRVRRVDRQDQGQPRRGAARPSCARCRASSRRSISASSATATPASPASSDLRLGLRVGTAACRRQQAAPSAGAASADAQESLASDGAPRRSDARFGGRIRFLDLRRRAAVARHRRVLPRPPASYPRGLRPHRDLGRHAASTAPRPTRSAPSARRCRASRSRSPSDGEILMRGRARHEGVLRQARTRRARPSTPTAGSTPATSACIDADGFLAHHRPQEGHHRHRRRQEHRAAEHRERAQGDAVHLAGRGARRPAALPGRARHPQRRERRASGRARTACPSRRRSGAVGQVRTLVQKDIDELNARSRAYSSIKKFAILPRDFSQETGELRRP